MVWQGSAGDRRPYADQVAHLGNYSAAHPQFPTCHFSLSTPKTPHQGSSEIRSNLRIADCSATRLTAFQPPPISPCPTIARFVFQPVVKSYSKIQEKVYIFNQRDDGLPENPACPTYVLNAYATVSPFTCHSKLFVVTVGILYNFNPLRRILRNPDSSENNSV